TTPSVVWFESEDSVVVGRDARRAGMVEPDRVAEDVKRYIGDEFYPRLVMGKRLSPISLSAIILKKLKQDAEARLTRVDGAVITVPAYFDEQRRQATAAAAEAAGLPLIDIINEPTAAALAHAFRAMVGEDGDVSAGASPIADGKTLVVYDLGGGTFDVTVLRAEGTNLTVQATAGDVRLGGRDWDERVYNYLADLFVREHGDDPRDDALARQQLYATAEDLKKDLTRRARTMFVINHAGSTMRGELTRQQFDELTADLLFRTESRLNRVLRDTALTWEEVDELLLVGGSTRMPQVREMIKRVTGKEATATISPDEAVAHGAAIHAAIALANLTEGEARPAGKVIPPAEETVPASSGSDEDIPPQAAEADLAVHTQGGAEAGVGDGSLVNQLAAALDAQPGQGSPPPIPKRFIDDGQRQRFLASLAGRIGRLLGLIRTTNVNAHSLGVVAEDRKGRKRVVRLIPRNTRLPAQKEKCFATVTEDQSRVVVQIVEGESDVVEDCVQIGTCLIEALPPKLPKGSPIEITFRYDGSGRLFVQAVHMTSGAWAETAIHRGGGIDPRRVHLNQEILSKLRVS
ncbi:MAG: Hsp70 family protein, partial [Phycisphaeraceae bacterium]